MPLKIIRHDITKNEYRISEKLFADIREYIDDNYVDEYTMLYPEARRMSMPSCQAAPYASGELSENICFKGASAEETLEDIIN